MTLIITSKVCSEIKETTFWAGHFTTISGHSIANYIYMFQKPEVQTVICYFEFGRKKMAIFDHLWSLFDKYIVDIFHKTRLEVPPSVSKS